MAKKTTQNDQQDDLLLQNKTTAPTNNAHYSDGDDGENVLQDASQFANLVSTSTRKTLEGREKAAKREEAVKNGESVEEAPPEYVVMEDDTELNDDGGGGNGSDAGGKDNKPIVIPAEMVSDTYADLLELLDGALLKYLFRRGHFPKEHMDVFVRKMQDDRVLLPNEVQNIWKDYQYYCKVTLKNSAEQRDMLNRAIARIAGSVDTSEMTPLQAFLSVYGVVTIPKLIPLLPDNVVEIIFDKFFSMFFKEK